MLRFVRAYEQGTWSGASFDWLDERVDGAVELVATRATDGATLAIEHTVIQPHPKEKEDFARFRRSSLGKDDRDPSIEIPQSFLYVNIPIGTLHPGQDWDAVADVVRECIRAHKNSIPEGRSELLCRVNGTVIQLQVQLVRDLRQNSCRTIIRRYGNFDLSATVRTALENKLPKLVATVAQKHLLMLERDQWQLSHESVAAEIEGLRSDFPLLQSVDEIWIAETHDNGAIVLFEPVVHGRRYAPVYTFHGETLLHASRGY